MPTSSTRADETQTSVGTGANVLGSNHLSMKGSVSRLRIFVSLDTATTFSVVYNPGDANEESITLNDGNALTAGQAHLEDVLVTKEDTINFQHGDAGTVTVKRLLAVEIPVNE